MKNVILYARVSTDEQAERNLSLPSQVEKLTKYCEIKGWKVIKVFEESYSAWRGFDRPEYNKLKKFAQENKKKIDHLLFIQWSRFSRNLGESITEIESLKKLGIEANATEQWVDMNIPENQYVLAFYLTAPQVENERLSLRVKAALRQALKQGKWMGRAPYGYVNDKATKLVLPDSKTKDIVAFAFNTFSTGAYTIEEVRKMATHRGLSIQKQQFINMLSNPFYVGKIFVPALGDEPELYVKGLHEGIINAEIFYAVQDILNGKRKPYQGKTKGENLPLKGHLRCPNCGRLMTGSGSKSRNGNYYHYYHCQRKYGCKNSIPADEANTAFEKYINKFQVSHEVLTLYYSILEDKFKTDDTDREQEKKQVANVLKGINDTIKGLDEKFLNGELPSERYNRLTDALESQRLELQSKLEMLSKSASEYAKYIQFSTALLADLTGYYKKASLLTKQKLVGSIFPEKIEYIGKNYRTARINEVFTLICNLDKGFRKRKPGIATGLSISAPPVGLEPTTL
ncbi:MAG TPA: recombinase family protein [Chitinophagaceae bacterium]|nr:recombinase family protein [Chitinophagaceae bacterium]